MDAGQRQAQAPKPRKIVLDYRYGWYHPATGNQTLRAIAAIYQRDAALVARLNRATPETRPAAGTMVYIPPNDDVAYVRQALARVNADPRIVPTEPWHEPASKTALARMKATAANDALEQALGAPRGRMARARAGASTEAVATPDPSPDAPYAPLPPGAQTFAWPVQGRVVTPFGEGWTQACHGIEMAADQGATVRASRAGKVLLAQEFIGYGQLVLIDHGDGYASVYAYLGQVGVRKGQRVTQGQPIAAVGLKGSTPMFFFEIRRQGQKVDPLLYLK
jgi:murein DD-endopeptidase MepM/ murein hydrolase activator NlpD